MKKIVSIFIAIIAVLSCTKKVSNNIENTLIKKVYEETENIKKYKTEKISVIDTITVADEMLNFEKSFSKLFFEKNIETFTKRRNQEFKEFGRSKNYEEEIMRGELKDASPWCTEIREITEKADSILKNWDNVNVYDYDYVFVNLWYLRRHAGFYGNYEYKYAFNSLLNTLPNYKKDFEYYKELSSLPKNNILYYNIEYVYSYLNTLINNRIKVICNVKITPNMEIIEFDTNDFDVI